ncbi:MAG: YceI family protein [Chloroflexota bacterium]
MTVRRRTSAALALAALVALAVPAAAPAQSPPPAASAAPVVAATLDGTWTVDPTLGSFDYAAGDFSGSWAGYRVQEELVGMGGITAVGRTPAITGSITLAGTTLAAAELVVDLTTLQSDDGRRDGQLARQGIEYDMYPTATFVLTAPVELGTLPAEGEARTVEAVGDLTLHGVTKSVTIPLGVIRQGDVIGAAGAVDFTWEDFSMEKPRSMIVLSLADTVTMEMQVFFRRDAGTPAASPVGSPAP